MPLNKSKGEEDSEITVNTDESEYYEIDWNKVQLIGDLKVILEKLNFKFSEDIIEENDPILKYLKK